MNKESPKPQTTWFKRTTLSEWGERTQASPLPAPTPSPQHLCLLDRDIPGDGSCACPPRYQLIWIHRLNSPNPLLLGLCAPTTAVAAQFTNSLLSKLPPFIYFSDNVLAKTECLPALVLRDLFDCPIAFTSSSTSFVKLCVFPFCKQESQLLWFLLTNTSAPSL